MKIFWLVGLIVTIVFNLTAHASDEKSAAELMQQWINLESQKGKLQTDWSQRQQQLQQRLTLFKLEQDALEQVIKKSSEVTNDVDTNRLALTTEQSKLEAEQQQVSAQLALMTDNLQNLVNRLPPPLQQEWLKKIPLINASTNSNSEKLEHILSLFKLANEFDQRIAMHRTSMPITSLDGKAQQILVTQIYIGLSQGWYVNEDGAVYGYGRADQLGWQWFSQQDADSELGTVFPIASLIKLRDTLDNPTQASYLTLPVSTLGK